MHFPLTSANPPLPCLPCLLRVVPDMDSGKNDVPWYLPRNEDTWSRVRACIDAGGKYVGNAVCVCACVYVCAYVHVCVRARVRLHVCACVATGDIFTPTSHRRQTSKACGRLHLEFSRGKKRTFRWRKCESLLRCRNIGRYNLHCHRGENNSRRKNFRHLENLVRTRTVSPSKPSRPKTAVRPVISRFFGIPTELAAGD